MARTTDYWYNFNTFLKERFGERVQKVVLDAGLSCPNRDTASGTGGCIYCDARGSGSGGAARYPDLQSQALAGMDAMAKRYGARKFIVYFQSFCNTCAPLEKLQAMYEQVAWLPGVVGLAVATRPDCLWPGVLELLSGYAARRMVWLELGLQSAHDSTLKRINRGHTWQQFVDGYRLARRYPLLVCVHVIIGLPGESRNDVLATAGELARLRPEGLKIHSLYIHRDTALHELYAAGTCRPLEQAEFVEQACDFLEATPAATVIQRLTGDPDPRNLVAPAWSLEKQQTLALIAAEMQRRNTRQGARCPL